MHYNYTKRNSITKPRNTKTQTYGRKSGTRGRLAGLSVQLVPGFVLAKFCNEINSTVGRTRTDTGSPPLDSESLFSDLKFLRDFLNLLEKHGYL